MFPFYIHTLTQFVLAILAEEICLSLFIPCTVLPLLQEFRFMLVSVNFLHFLKWPCCATGCGVAFSGIKTIASNLPGIHLLCRLKHTGQFLPSFFT